MRVLICISAFLLIMSTPAYTYNLLTDKANGGNPKLDKKIYKVYIQSDPTSNMRDDEVKNALDKWKAELGPRGIDLQVQAGSPPTEPVNFDKFNQEVKQFNEAINNGENPDISDFPEIEKLNQKNCTVNVYFKTTAEINQLGGGSERGRANNFWSLDSNGKADKIDATDIFLPTDPPGGNEDIKKRVLHNIAMHEFAHMSGLDHYTPAQLSDGDVLESDATLHSEKLPVGPEEKKGLDAVYGNTPTLKLKSKAESKETSSLPQSVQDQLPSELASIWEYQYDIFWEDGAPVSYFQIETGRFPIYAPAGLNGLDDWLVDIPLNAENYLEFYSDSTYLGDNVFEGSLQFYSDAAPGQGWLAYSGGSEFSTAPVPEPMSLWLFGSALLGLPRSLRSRKKRIDIDC